MRARRSAAVFSNVGKPQFHPRVQSCPLLSRMVMVLAKNRGQGGPCCPRGVTRCSHCRGHSQALPSSPVSLPHFCCRVRSQGSHAPPRPHSLWSPERSACCHRQPHSLAPRCAPSSFTPGLRHPFLQEASPDAHSWVLCFFVITIRPAIHTVLCSCPPPDCTPGSTFCLARGTGPAPKNRAFDE